MLPDNILPDIGNTITSNDRISLVGDTERKDTLLLVLPAFMVPSLEDACRSMLAQIEPSTSTIIATHSSTAAQISLWLEEYQLTQRCHLITVDDDIVLSMWVQDDVHIVRDDNGSLSLLISRQAEAHVLCLMQQIADVADMSITLVENAPDGGNILVGDDFILVGGDDWNGGEKLSLPGCCNDNSVAIASRMKAATELKRPLEIIGDDWQEVVHFGNRSNSRQPVFHIDIFLSLAGRDENNRPRVLVGDPGMAAHLLDRSPPDHDLQEHFDDIADQLECNGFSVIRNPLPLTYCDLLEKRERHWYFSSSNNVIVQDCDTSGRIVWLPTYGHGNWPQLTITDDANILIWKDLGFEVRAIAHCQPLAENLGGLRCFSKSW